MAFEITVREALAILQLSEENPKSLLGRGKLKEFVVRDYRGRMVWRFLHYEEVLGPARTLARKIVLNPLPPTKDLPLQLKPVAVPELMSPGLAARIMDIRTEAVRALIFEGKLRVARRSRKGQLELRREDVVALIEATRASRCRPATKGKHAGADELVDVPTAALLLNAMPVRVYTLVRKGLLQVAHVSADGARCFRREEVLALAGLAFPRGRRSRGGPGRGRSLSQEG